MTDNETTELEEQLVEARAQIEQLQASAADAEARAATARAEIKSSSEAQEHLRAELAEATAACDEARGELSGMQQRMDGMQAQLREAASKYRAARLSSAPDVPHDLVPELDTIEDIDREFESAQRVVGQLREKIEREAVEQHRSARIPAGAPPRRQQDVSSLPASEKIRIGIQQRDERNAR